MGIKQVKEYLLTGDQFSAQRALEMGPVKRHGHVRLRGSALVLRHAEPEHPGVEVNDGIQVVREDLVPHRHPHG